MDRYAWRTALGDLRDTPAAARAMFDTDVSFDELPPPRQGEWLAIHEEHGQTFDEYVRAVSRPSLAERTIYLQPTDEIPGLSDECLSVLAAFTGAFFGLDVRVLEALPLDPSTLSPRVAADTHRRQVCAGDILRRLLARKPADAFCVLAITAHDLYPHPIVSFAFGEASSTHRVGVCSVARYGPPFCQDPPAVQLGAMRRRCCRVIAHEIGHMAGIEHCVYFRCLMNGSSDITESERRPLHLCPVDLHKLHWLLGFDLNDRYRRLRDFWRDAGDDREARWAGVRLLASMPRWRRLAALASETG